MRNVNPMPGGCRFASLIHKNVLSLCGEPDSILELGCGSGGNLSEFACRRFGIDPDPDNIQLAAKALSIDEVVLADHSHLTQFNVNSFNVGITCSVLDHIENFKEALDLLMLACRRLVLFEPIARRTRQAKKTDTIRWKSTWYHNYERFLSRNSVPFQIKSMPLYRKNSGRKFHRIFIECSNYGETREIAEKIQDTEEGG